MSYNQLNSLYDQKRYEKAKKFINQLHTYIGEKPPIVDEEPVQEDSKE